MPQLHPMLPTAASVTEQLGLLAEHPGLLDTLYPCPIPGITPRMIAVGGLPASGKSTLIRALQPHLTAMWIATDAVRKNTAGVPLTTPWPSGSNYYSPQAHWATYAHAHIHARSALAYGYPVLFDATWVNAASRQRLRQTVADANVPFTGLFISVAEDVALARMAARAGTGSNMSDAKTAAVYHRLQGELAEGEGFDALHAEGWHVLDNNTADNGESLLHAALTYLA